MSGKEDSEEESLIKNIEYDPSSHFTFDSLYSLTCQVGKGGFGVVYEGVRRGERGEGVRRGEGGAVAVKFVWKDKVRRWGQVVPYFISL